MKELIIFIVIETIITVLSMFIACGLYQLAIVYPVIKFFLIGVGIGAIIVIIINLILNLFD